MTGTDIVREHYGTRPLCEMIAQALDQLGCARPGWKELAALDQFHVRGLAATKELTLGLAPAADDHVLDVGCGLGGPARYLAATTGCRVTGIDLSVPFVEAARLLTDRSGLEGRVTVRVADALDLPFGDKTFDHAWTQHVAMNIADRAGFYGEIHRVLKPGGRLAIYDVIAGDGGDVIYPVPWADRPEISFLVTLEAMRSALTGAGFEEISVEDVSQDAIDWFGRQKAGGPPPALALPLVMGPGFPAMTANLRRNLAEGRIRMVEAMVRRV
ncbi:MAG: class I SAM-dependent methyltransferase [Telmatospirillum sp.]|nr:class I SAM-dependent methyltransferase [Telmatospirillum sp.]